MIKIVSKEAHPLSTALLWETVCWGWVHSQGRIRALKGVLSIEVYARTTREGEANLPGPLGGVWLVGLGGGGEASVGGDVRLDPEG